MEFSKTLKDFDDMFFDEETEQTDLEVFVDDGRIMMKIGEVKIGLRPDQALDLAEFFRRKAAAILAQC